MSHPLLSVVVPVYNVEKYLGECVDSIRACRGPIEIILVDDGSKDGSGAICDSLAASDQRIRAIHKENGGLSSARNAGMDSARGKYLQFVDSDDWVDREGEGKLLGLLEEGREELYLVDGNYEYRGFSSPMRSMGEEALGSYTGPGLLWEMKKRNCYAVEAVRSVHEREALAGKKLRFEEGLRREDEDWTPRAFAAAQRATYTGINLYRYRQRKSSITRGGGSHTKDVLGTIERQIAMLRKAEGEERLFLANNIVDLFQFVVLSGEGKEEASYAKAISALSELPRKSLLFKQRINRTLYSLPGLYRRAYLRFRSEKAATFEAFYD
jgi:glycosyltransferase involved in cell wall biosynthesis